MKIRLIRELPPRGEKETYLTFIYQDEAFKPYDLRDSWATRSLIKEGFKGAHGEISIVTSPEKGASRYVCVGLGKKEEMTARKFKQVIGIAARALQKKKMDSYTLVMPEFGRDIAQYVQLAVLALHEATYQFNTYITNKDRVLSLPKKVSVAVLEKKANSKELSKALVVGNTIGEASSHVRELGNMPPIDMTPTVFAREAQKVAKKHKNLTCKVLGPAALKKEKMGGLLAVSAGSREPAQFVVLEYSGASKKKAPVVLAGKAVTFDSGGITLKPGQKLDEMKFDMLGGATVLGAIDAIAALKLPVNVVGLIGATENLLGEAAYRPGDIITAKNGKTIEVLNTDAEGRIVLADALSYAKKYKPRMAIDLATLTGACVVALGADYAGVFTRSDDISDQLKSSGEMAGEQLWRLPLDDDFKKEIESPVADVRNVGLSRYGDSSLAAAFLENFVEYPWAHIDIAGVAWTEERSYRSAGATGFGIDTLVRFIEQQKD